ncbi:MAG TPA: hypothetical protein VN222_15695 [Novosphingobium sp.]|nr:hypothetical protein [Novosphingobium sp.]
MSTDEFPPEDSEAGASGKTSVLDEIAALIDSGLGACRAEVAFQKARAVLAARLTGRIALLALLVLALLFFVLLALVMGLLLALAPLIGPWAALGAVVGGLLVVIALAALAAYAAWRRLRRVLGFAAAEVLGAVAGGLLGISALAALPAYAGWQRLCRVLGLGPDRDEGEAP